MTRRCRRQARAGWGLSLCILLAWVGCQQRSAEVASRKAGEEKELRPVALPGLDDFPESVREQLRSQQARLEALAGRRESDPAMLGEAYGVMGQLLLAYDLDHAAEPALLNAANLLPEDVRWPYYLGHLYQGDGKLERTARHFERALALQPEDMPTRIYLALVYRDLGRDSDAQALLHEAIRIDPRSAVAHLLLGHMAALDRPSEAIAHYETVLRLQPTASVVRYPLGLAYSKQGDLERSREQLARRGDADVKLHDPLFEDLERIRKGSGAKIFQGNRLTTEGRYREAAAFFEQAVAEDSAANVTAYLNLAVAVAQLGKAQEAIQALEQVLRLDPSNSAAHYNLGILFGGRGEDEKALEYFRAAVDADPSNSVARIALANLLWRKRRCQEAIPHFEKFLATSPEHREARMSQAVCHAHLGEYAEARKLLEAGYEAFPQEPILQDAMIRVLAASPDASVRDGKRALEMAKRLTAAFRRPETLESLAMAYAELGRFPEAIRYQREVIRAAEGEVPASLLDYLQSNLRRYEQGKPCRTPWPPTVFDR